MRIVIYGSRPDGHAKVLVDLLAYFPDLETVGLIDDLPQNRSRTVRGLAVLGGTEVLATLRGRDVAGLLIGFGDAPGRSAAMEAARQAGLELPSLIHPTAVASPTATLGDGCQLLATSYVGPDAVVGDGVLVNTGAVIEHDVELGEGVVIGPGAVLTGRVSVATGTDIGAGAIVLPDCHVGEGSRVGAGAVVTRDVRPGTVVIGVPARELAG